MPSAVWSGHLHFGLVVMPVRLLVAARTKTTRFKRLYRKPVTLASFPDFPSDASEPEDDSGFSDRLKSEAGSGAEQASREDLTQFEYSPVRQVLRSEETGEEIRPDELVKGYEFEPNQFAPIDPEAIRAAAIETSDTIDIFHFVKASDVDPIYFERSYYLVPDSGAEKVYSLLLQAMRKEECLGIARIGMHRREHTLILRPSEECMVAHTMFYANEVRPAPHFESPAEFTAKELSMATALIKGYAGEFDPTQFKDLYQERIREIVDAEVTHQVKVRPASTRSTPAVPDLMEQIRLSLAQIESTAKTDPKPVKKPVRKTSAAVKKKPQRARA